MALSYYKEGGSYYKKTSSGGTYKVTSSNDIKRAKAYIAGGGTSSPTTTTSKTTTAPKESVDDTVARAKAMLGSAYDPNTAAPTAARLDEIANYVGTYSPETKAAYTTSKLQPVIQDYMAATYNASLPTTTLSTDASKIPSPYQDVALGTPTIGTGDISSAISGISGLSSLNAANQNFYQQQLDRQLAQQEENKSMLQQLMASMTSPGEARQNAWDETGMDVEKHFAQQEAGFKEIESLTNEYNNTMMMKDQQIAQTHDRLASNNFINNQIAQIERNAAPKLNRLSADINAKAAVLQALQGNFAEAQKYVNQAVQDATAENKFKYDMFSMAFELNNNAFDRIEAIYSDAYKSQMAIAQMQYEEQKAEKEQIGNLLLQYPNAGIDIYNDSLQEAMEKAGIRAGVLENIALTLSSGGSGGFSTEDWSYANMVMNGQRSLGDFTPTQQSKIANLIWSQPVPDTLIEQYKQQYISQMDSGSSTSMSGLNNAAKAAAEVAWDTQRMQLVGPGAGNTPKAVVGSFKEAIDLSDRAQQDLMDAGMSMDDLANLNEYINNGYDITQLGQAGLDAGFVNILREYVKN